MNFLQSLGVLTLITAVALIIGMLIISIHELIDNFKNEYRYKHRFDKPPTAKCYCRDCVRWDPETGKCDDHCNSRRMADSWFCCFAEPGSKELLDERNKILDRKE